jgi:hypothetical protein
MPETCFPIRTRRRVLIPSPVLTLLLIGATLGGCSGGDFGRTRQDFVSDDMHRWIGEEATGSVGLHPSQFQLTDTERQLRDLAYQMIEPPRSRPAWKSVFGDYATIASPWRHRPVFDRTTYGRQLIDEPHVFDLDRKRNASLAHISELSPRERADAVARMEENTLIVQWVQQCLERRISSYHWALERLVLQAPDNMAADADRLISELAAQAAHPPVAAQPAIGHVLSTRG